MDPKNPYRSPLSDVTPPVGGVDTTNPFDPNGRFNRLSWLAWNLVVAFGSALIGGAIAAVLTASGLLAMPADPQSAALPAMGIGAIIFMVAFYIALLVAYVLLMIRRFHDMDVSGWASLLMLIPFVNFIAGLVLLFKRGTEGANRFGPPRPSRGWERVLGIIYIVLIVLGFVGLVAAIAIPAYMGYPQSIVTP